MDTQPNYFATAIQYWPAAVIFIIATASIIGLLLIIKLAFNRHHLLHRDMVWLEITPPSNVAKTPQATEQLFSVLHGMHAARSLREKLLGYSPTMSFEITSTRKDGIRYIIQVEKKYSKTVQKAITSYIPESKVTKITHQDMGIDKAIEFRETNHYILPLMLASMFKQHDPLSYITGAMTQLADNEELTLQLIVTPIKLHEAHILSHKILSNENILQQVSNKRFSLLGMFTSMTNSIAANIIDAAGDVYMSTRRHREPSERAAQQAHSTAHDRPSRVLSSFERELMETMHRKVTQPLFQVNLRILIKSRQANSHITAIKSALDGYSVPPYQALKAKITVPVISAARQKAAIRRMPSLLRRSAIILAASELASLYHVPSSHYSRTDNLITSLSRMLPAPVSLKQTDTFDVTIGMNVHHNTKTPIGLTALERERHQYIIGGTGNGKTTMLQYQIVQDMKNDKGVAVIDPHGDMAETLLRYVPPERIKDVIYFNPDDLEYPIGLNLLELTPGLEGNELLREKDIITESIVSIFRKLEFPQIFTALLISPIPNLKNAKI